MEIKKNDEIEKNVIVFDYSGTRCEVSIIKQEKHLPLIEGSCDLRTYQIRSESTMQITEDTFFMKGEHDNTRGYETRSCDIPTARRWEKIFRRLKRFEVFNTMSDATRYIESLKENEQPTTEPKQSLKLEYNPSDEEIQKMIDKVDLDTFCKIIQCRLKREYNGAFGSPNCSMEMVGKINHNWAKEYLKEWAKQKYRFYKLFGENLKIEKEVEGIATLEEISNNIAQLKNKFPLFAPIISSIATECIKQNKMFEDGYANIFDKYEKGIKGMTFTKFMSLYGNNEMNIEISKMYQSTGKTNITISIDPCDYLSVSINNCNWKSCHNFFNGMYANAPLAYMHDDTSMVAFSSNGNTKYTDGYKIFEWNNKRWRQMIFLSKENSAICFSRQYPHYDDRFEDEVRKMLEQTYSDYFKVDNKWYISKNDKYMDVFSLDAVNSVFYNDVANGYDCKTIVNKNDPITSPVECYIGGIAKKMLRDEPITRKDEPIW